MNIDMQSPEIQKLKRENPAEYRRKYDNHRLYNKEWYCDHYDFNTDKVCNSLRIQVSVDTCAMST